MADDAGIDGVDAATQPEARRAIRRSALEGHHVAEYLDAGAVRAAFRRAAGPTGLVRHVRFPALPRVAGLPTFAAIDFETADAQRDSACSLAIVRVEQGALVEAFSFLIRPERLRGHIPHEWIHGISWDMVAHAPSFAEVWTHASRLLDGVDALVAHNAAFDRSVLEASCRDAGVRPPALEWVCTVKRTKHVLGMKRARLPLVCRALGIALEHHDPLSDAIACAQVMVASLLVESCGMRVSMQRSHGRSR
jgi:DNA polymerase-3 subunit epsilon